MDFIFWRYHMIEVNVSKLVKFCLFIKSLHFTMNHYHFDGTDKATGFD